MTDETICTEIDEVLIELSDPCLTLLRDLEQRAQRIQHAHLRLDDRGIEKEIIELKSVLNRAIIERLKQ